MAGGAPPHCHAAVWVKESVDDGAQHDGPAKQGKGLLIMQVWAARHAGHAQHGSHGSHGMGQQGEVGWQVERRAGPSDLREQQADPWQSRSPASPNSPRYPTPRAEA